MSKLRKSVVLPSSKSDRRSIQVQRLSNSGPSCSEAQNLNARFIQNQACALLAARKRHSEEESVLKKNADMKQTIKALKKHLQEIRNRIAALEHIIQRYRLLHEQSEIVDDLEAKVNNTKKGDVENLIAHLHSATSKLLVGNFVLPQVDVDKRACQYHIQETLKTLSEYDQLKLDSKFDAKKLASLLQEFELLSSKAQTTATNCVILENKIKEQVLEHNVKKCMLGMKKRHKERKQSGELFIQMSKLSITE